MYKRNTQGWLKHIDFIIWDILSLQVAFVIAFVIRRGEIPYKYEDYRVLAGMYIVIDVLVSAGFNTMHNVMKRGYYREIAESLKHVAMILMFISLFMFSVQSGDIYSRIAIYLTTAFHFGIGYIVRLWWKTVVRRNAKTIEKASMVLVADERAVPEILEHISTTDNVEYTGIVLTNRDGTGEEIAGIPVVAGLETAAEHICREHVDEVFIYYADFTGTELQEALNEDVEELINDPDGDDEGKEHEIKQAAVSEAGDKEATVASLIEDCRQMAIPVHVRIPSLAFGEMSFVEKVAGYNVLTSAANCASSLQMALKRLLDILGGLIGSVIALVIIAVLAPIIKKESPGPILFAQERIGFNGKRFKMYKIRSMYTDAEERKAELMKNNRVSDGMMFKLDWDPRIIGNKIVDGKQVTGIGEKIRSGSWDEWPQFFNILRGDMSLVGTRPPTVDEWEKYKFHHRARLATKPGLTGMWQVSGRSRITDFEEVVKLDTEYINHWSIGLDIRILLKTVKAVLAKDGAM